jgi:hypothetical protein
MGLNQQPSRYSPQNYFASAVLATRVYEYINFKSSSIVRANYFAVIQWEWVTILRVQALMFYKLP